MKELRGKIEQAVGTIESKITAKPQVGIILGTGLSKLSDEIADARELPYADIPHFPTTTLAHHTGRLVFGTISGRKVVAMDGRVHFYEGYSLEQVTFPVRVMRALGAKLLVVSGACGGMNPQYNAGDVLIIEDHINLMGVNPLIGPNDDNLGPRFPDMCEPYDKELIRLADRIALEETIKAHTGVYVAVAGPNLETRAEYRFLRTIGADAVGMSSVPEVLVAIHGGMKVLGLAIITDKCLPDALQPANIEAIIKVAEEAEPKLTRIVKRVLKEMPDPEDWG